MSVDQVLWSRTYEGRHPELRKLDERRVIFQFEPVHAAEGESFVTVCLDAGGRELWRRDDVHALLTLPGGRWLADAPGGGSLQVQDDGFRPVHSLGSLGKLRAERFGDRLCLSGEDDHIVVTDLELKPVAEFERPSKLAHMLNLVDDHFHWVEWNEIWRCDLQGRAEQVGEIPKELCLRTLEEAFGRPSEEPVSPLFPPEYLSGRDTPLVFGDRPYWLQWWLQHDPEANVFYASNVRSLHLLLKLEMEFQPIWSRVLAPSCCGGVPYRLPDGLLAASSGCSGIVTWLTEDGEARYRSDAIELAGVAGALDNRLTVLRNGTVIVSGGFRLSAYHRGDSLWSVDRWLYTVLEQESLLVTAAWRGGEGEDHTRTVSIDVRPLPAFAAC